MTPHAGYPQGSVVSNLFAFILCTAQLACGSADSGEVTDSSVGPLDATIVVDVSPLESGTASQYLITRDGRFFSFDYVPARRIINEVLERKLEPAVGLEIQELVNSILDERPFALAYPVEDDQVRVSMCPVGGRCRNVAGGLEAASAQTYKLVDRLAGLREVAKNVALRHGYIRCSPISEKRINSIKKGGRFRILRYDEMAQAEQRILYSPLDRPFAFAALDEPQIALLTVNVSSTQMFLVYHGVSFDCEMYASNAS